MKRTPSAIFIIALFIGFNPFIHKKADKSFSVQAIYYKSGMDFQRIEPNITSGGSDAEKSINMDPQYLAGNYSLTQFCDVGNWSTSAAGAGTYCNPTADGSNYLWSFTISDYQGVGGSASDYSDYNGISMEQAVQEVLLYYRSNLFLPISLTVDMDGLPGNNITLYNFVVSDDVH